MENKTKMRNSRLCSVPSKLCVHTQISETAHWRMVVDNKKTIIRQTINFTGTSRAPIQVEDILFFVSFGLHLTSDIKNRCIF